MYSARNFHNLFPNKGRVFPLNTPTYTSVDSMDIDKKDSAATHSDMSQESWFSSDTCSGYLEDVVAKNRFYWDKQQFSSPSSSQEQYSTSPSKVDSFPRRCDTSSRLFEDDFSGGCSKFTIGNNLASKQDLFAAETKEAVITNTLTPKEQKKKITCPFELVKPGGVEGETTLKDINEQMLMSPSKPIPHPVDDFVTPPSTSSTGFGLSGKAVMAITKIQTKGRGSITIIRTKS